MKIITDMKAIVLHCPLFDKLPLNDITNLLSTIFSNSWILFLPLSVKSRNRVPFINVDVASNQVLNYALTLQKQMFV